MEDKGIPQDFSLMNRKQRRAYFKKNPARKEYGISFQQFNDPIKKRKPITGKQK